MASRSTQKSPAVMNHQLKITLQHVDPPVWRRVVVPSEYTLFELHCVIQAVMGWEDCHLHEFTIKRQRFAMKTPGSFDDGATEDEDSARLSDVAAPRSKFIYHYDFGDSWLHSILVEKVGVESPAPVPVCTAGARACPPEDCGGPFGYAEKLGALSGDDQELADEVREWIGDFDPELFELDLVNKELDEIFRPAPRKKRKSTRRA